MSMARRYLATLILSAILVIDAVAASRASVPECLPDAPIDCSVSWGGLIRLVTAFSIIFDDACLTHDLCYRHGERTYGYAKAKCDADFVDDLDTICRSPVRFIDFVTLGLSRVTCLAAKRAAGAALTRTAAAERSFRTGERSTCCRYDQAGIPLPECAV